MASPYFMDGFDYYATSKLGEKWTNVTSTSPTITSGGRILGNCLSFDVGSYSISKTLVNKQSWSVSFSFWWGGEQTDKLVNLIDGSTNQMGMDVRGDGKVQISRDGAWPGASGDVSTLILDPNKWYYVTFQGMIADDTTAHSCRIIIDNVVWVDLGAHAVTENSGNLYAQTIEIRGPTSGAAGNKIDDLFIWEGIGANTPYLEKWMVETMFPAATGTYTDWTATGGANQHVVLAESSEDGDTSYVSSNTATNKCTNTSTPLATPPDNIYAIQTNLIARDDAAGSHTICATLRIGSTNYDQTTSGTVTSSYKDYLTPIEKSPATTAAWTRSELEAMESGVKLVS